MYWYRSSKLRYSRWTGYAQRHAARLHLVICGISLLPHASLQDVWPVAVGQLTESMQSWFWNMLKRLKLRRLIYIYIDCTIDAFQPWLNHRDADGGKERERDCTVCIHIMYHCIFTYYNILHINTLHIVNTLDITTSYPYDHVISGTTSPPAAMWSKAAAMPRAKCGAEWTRTAAFGPTSQGSKAGRCLRSNCWPKLITA